MTDAHAHVSCGDPTIRELLIGREFVGCHPWEADSTDIDAALTTLAARLNEDTRLGVGEIGLDRLHDRTISDQMRNLFARQFTCALDNRRPVVLHGAKCWGQVVSEVQRLETLKGDVRVPLLFHGFSRSDGLIPDIAALGGFISIGPAILNDHAVNYRALAKKIPSAMLLIETDRTTENRAASPSISDVLTKLAVLRGVSNAELEALTDANAKRFYV